MRVAYGILSQSADNFDLECPQWVISCRSARGGKQLGTYLSTTAAGTSASSPACRLCLRVAPGRTGAGGPPPVRAPAAEAVGVHVEALAIVEAEAGIIGAA